MYAFNKKLCTQNKKVENKKSDDTLTATKLSILFILLFFLAAQNDLLLSNLIAKTTSYSREHSLLITHITYTHARS